MATDFLVTTGILGGLLVGSQLLRTTLANNLPHGSLMLGVLLEAIATFELCAVSFEQGLLFEYYGINTFHVALFFICLWRFYMWRNVSTVPFSHFEQWLDGKISFGISLLYVASELGAGALVYQYFTKPVWSLDLSAHHTTKLHNFAVKPCQTAVNVHYLNGALIEGGFTFLIELSFYLLSKLHNVSNHLLNAVRAAMITGLVYAAFYTTGGFMSPVLATVLQYNCGGITALRHAIVYWVGPALGSLLMYLVKRYAFGGGGGSANSDEANGNIENRKSR